MKNENIFQSRATREDSNVAPRQSFRNTKPEVRWTKDSVEHARNVHLTLITIAAGLILLVASAKSYRPKALEQITEIAALKQQWTPNWVWQHRLWRNDDSINRTGLDRALSPEIAPGVLWYSVVNIAPHMVVTVYNSDTKQLKRDTQLAVNMPDDLWLVQSPQNGLELRDNEMLTYDPVSLDFFPENLDQFQKWWGDLQTGRGILHPDQLAGLCTMVDDSKRVVTKLTLISKEEYRGREHSLRTLNVKATLNSFGQLGDQVSYEAYDPVTNLTLVIPLASSRRFHLDQALLSSVYHWPTGSYETSFPELIKAAKGLEYIPLDDLQKNFTRDADKGAETFEALGVKLPAEQITTVGLLLILAVQLYLFLCVRQYSAPVPANDPIWNVPWMGMDQSPPGRSVFFLSLALATAAVTALATNAMINLLGNDSAWSWRVWNSEGMMLRNRARVLGEAALFLSAICLSIFFSIASWMSRPKCSLADPTIKPERVKEGEPHLGPDEAKV